MYLTDKVSAGLRKAGDTVVLWSDNNEFTGNDLERRANQLAHYLRAQGVGPDVLVGLCVERSAEMVIGLVAILKAGGAYVPLDPDYPAERLRFMLSDANVPILLTQEKLVATLPESSATVVCLDSDWNTISREPCTAPERARSATPDDLAYVIYTSGSTGQPKGAMNSHRAICNRIDWMQATFKLCTDDVVLQKTPFSFDVSVWEFFWPLIVGARLVMLRPGGHQDAAHIADTVSEHRISIMHFVPSMLQFFLDQGALREKCRTLRAVICSGEALTHELQERFFATMDAELHNLYGPTEAAVDVTHWPCVRQSAEQVVPIGWPISNTQIRILDDALNEVPAGETGELHIGGVQVGRGYWNRPELSAERFIDDPFRAGTDQRLYKTGDLARQRSDGAIEYLGRIDHQVKIRGLRIELGEIEARLEGMPDIKQAAVMVCEPAPGDKRLVAYCVADGSATIAMESVRKALAVHLPEYMLPQHIVRLDSMPVSPNGKLDRAKLPVLNTQRSVARKAIHDPVEKYVERIWAETLGLDFINTEERFFEIGGTSLSAARIVNRMQAELGEFIYVITMFESPTVEAYAKFLRSDYHASLAARLGLRIETAVENFGADAVDDNDAEMSEFQRSIIRLTPTLTPTKKNPPAIFVLAPPRSGTTLLRVMLAGHPDLFAAAELQLLCFNTLSERAAAYSGKYKLWLEGTLRAIMEIEICDAAGAEEIMNDMMRENLTTQACYERIQSAISPRTLVDKSPSYVLDKEVLNKAERDFEEPLYIHLVRHPGGMVSSFEKYHIEQVLYLKPNRFRGRRLGELVWLASHQNTLDFLSGIPQHRQFQLRFEDMVSQPERGMKDLCKKLGLSYDDALIAPYQNMGSKMIDGIHRESIPMGDTKMLERKSIEASAADAWMRELAPSELSSESWAMAERFGYQRPDSTATGTNYADVAVTGDGSDSLAARRSRRQAARRAISKDA